LSEPATTLAAVPGAGPGASPGGGRDGRHVGRHVVRRVAIGLGVALLVALGLQLAAYQQAATAAARSQERREALVAARAVADVVSAAGDDSAAVTAAVDRFGSRLPAVERIRVIDLASLSLVASSQPDDGAPRRLGRDEKTLYDRGQLLRSNRESNVQEGLARKPLALLERGAGGRLDVAVPVSEDGGAIRGAVLLDAVPAVAVRPPAWWVPLVLLAAALGLLLAAAALFGPRRVLLNVLAAVLLVATVGAYGLLGAGRLASDRSDEAAAVGQRLADTLATARQVTAQPAALDPAAWDADLLGRPRGEIGAGGEVDPAGLERALSASRARLVKLVAAATTASLVLLLFIGLGGAAHLGSTLRKHREAYLYVAPAMLGMIVLVFFPFAYGITLSFTESNLYNTDKGITEIWVGVDNYVEILSDWKVFEHTEDGLLWRYQNFYWTLGFTILWTVSNVAFGVTVGLFLALLLNAKGLALKPIYRVLLILPWAVPNYITALIWRGMFHRQFGVINQVLALLGIQPVSWFEAPLTSFLAVLSTNGWLSFPFMMVVSLGALQSIPSDLYEAARVDGAGRWQQFRSVTLPSLKPALVPAIILSVIWTFNMFNIIYLTSKGEPAHATEILITEAYKIAFEQYRYGYAAAYSTVIFLILLVYGVWQNRVSRATEAVG